MIATLEAQRRRPLWRIEDPEFDERGNVIRGGMLPHQREWWNLPNFIRGLVTGYGGGKTFSLGKRMIWLAYVNRGIPVITVSPTYPMAKLTIVDTIDELLDGKATHSKGMRYHLFKSQPYRFEINFGDGVQGQILCCSGEHPDRLKGSNVAAAGIDEPGMQDRAVFEQVLARVRHPRAVRREIDLTGTPEGSVGWFADLFEGDLRHKHDVGLVQCSSRENIALPSEYVDRLETAYDDRARAAYVDGRFVNLSLGQVYYGYDSTINDTEEEMPQGAELGCGLDFNVDPMAFVVFWRQGRRMHFFREFELPNSDTNATIKTLRAEFPALRKVYPDSSGVKRTTNAPHGKSDFAWLREAGFSLFAKPANPARRDRFNAVNAAMQKREVTISKACKQLRQYLSHYTHENAETDRGKAMGHLLDAFGYPIAYLLPATRSNAFTTSFSGA